MNPRTPNGGGSAGDANYGVLGKDYTRYRQPEPAIAQAILRALGDAQTVLNVGAGAGSYEPRERDVTAVESSAAMRAQRPPRRLAHKTLFRSLFATALIESVGPEPIRNPVAIPL